MLLHNGGDFVQEFLIGLGKRHLPGPKYDFFLKAFSQLLPLGDQVPDPHLKLFDVKV